MSILNQQPYPWFGVVDIEPDYMLQASAISNNMALVGGQNSAAILALLTGTPVPAGATYGGASGMGLGQYHQTIAPAGGAGTYTFAHGLQWAPTTVFIIPRNTQGVTPSLIATVDWPDTTATLIAVNVSGNGTYDIYYN